MDRPSTTFGDRPPSPRKPRVASLLPDTPTLSSAFPAGAEDVDAVFNDVLGFPSAGPFDDVAGDVANKFFDDDPADASLLDAAPPSYGSPSPNDDLHVPMSMGVASVVPTDAPSPLVDDGPYDGFRDTSYAPLFADGQQQQSSVLDLMVPAGDDLSPDHVSPATSVYSVHSINSSTSHSSAQPAAGPSSPQLGGSGGSPAFDDVDELPASRAELPASRAPKGGRKSSTSPAGSARNSRKRAAPSADPAAPASRMSGGAPRGRAAVPSSREDDPRPKSPVFDANVSPEERKRLMRLHKNRLSAHASRLRKKEYLGELENSISALREDNAALESQNQALVRQVASLTGGSDLSRQQYVEELLVRCESAEREKAALASENEQLREQLSGEAGSPASAAPEQSSRKRGRGSNGPMRLSSGKMSQVSAGAGMMFVVLFSVAFFMSGQQPLNYNQLPAGLRSGGSSSFDQDSLPASFNGRILLSVNTERGESKVLEYFPEPGPRPGQSPARHVQRSLPYSPSSSASTASASSTSSAYADASAADGFAMGGRHYDPSAYMFCKDPYVMRNVGGRPGDLFNQVFSVVVPSETMNATFGSDGSSSGSRSPTISRPLLAQSSHDGSLDQDDYEHDDEYDHVQSREILHKSSTAAHGHSSQSARSNAMSQVAGANWTKIHSNPHEELVEIQCRVVSVRATSLLPGDLDAVKL